MGRLFFLGDCNSGTKPAAARRPLQRPRRHRAEKLALLHVEALDLKLALLREEPLSNVCMDSAGIALQPLLLKLVLLQLLLLQPLPELHLLEPQRIGRLEVAPGA